MTSFQPGSWAWRPSLINESTPIRRTEGNQESPFANRSELPRKDAELGMQPDEGSEIPSRKPSMPLLVPSVPMKTVTQCRSDHIGSHNDDSVRMFQDEYERLRNKYESFDALERCRKGHESSSWQAVQHMVANAKTVAQDGSSEKLGISCKDLGIRSGPLSSAETVADAEDYAEMSGSVGGSCWRSACSDLPSGWRGPQWYSASFPQSDAHIPGEASPVASTHITADNPESCGMSTPNYSISVKNQWDSLSHQHNATNSSTNVEHLLAALEKAQRAVAHQSQASPPPAPATNSSAKVEHLLAALEQAQRAVAPQSQASPPPAPATEALLISQDWPGVVATPYFIESTPARSPESQSSISPPYARDRRLHWEEAPQASPAFISESRVDDVIAGWKLAPRSIPRESVVATAASLCPPATQVTTTIMPVRMHRHVENTGAPACLTSAKKSVQFAHGGLVRVDKSDTQPQEGSAKSMRGRQLVIVDVPQVWDAQPRTPSQTPLASAESPKFSSNFCTGPEVGVPQLSSSVPGKVTRVIPPRTEVDTVYASLCKSMGVIEAGGTLQTRQCQQEFPSIRPVVPLQRNCAPEQQCSLERQYASPTAPKEVFPQPGAPRPPSPHMLYASQQRLSNVLQSAPPEAQQPSINPRGRSRSPSMSESQQGLCDTSRSWGIRASRSPVRKAQRSEQQYARPTAPQEVSPPRGAPRSPSPHTLYLSQQRLSALLQSAPTEAQQPSINRRGRAQSPSMSEPQQGLCDTSRSWGIRASRSPVRTAQSSLAHSPVRTPVVQRTPPGASMRGISPPTPVMSGAPPWKHPASPVALRPRCPSSPVALGPRCPPSPIAFGSRCLPSPAAVATRALPTVVYTGLPSPLMSWAPPMSPPLFGFPPVAAPHSGQGAPSLMPPLGLTIGFPPEHLKTAVLRERTPSPGLDSDTTEDTAEHVPGLPASTPPVPGMVSSVATAPKARSANLLKGAPGSAKAGPLVEKPAPPNQPPPGTPVVRLGENIYIVDF